MGDFVWKAYGECWRFAIDMKKLQIIFVWWGSLRLAPIKSIQLIPHVTIHEIFTYNITVVLKTDNTLRVVIYEQ